MSSIDTLDHAHVGKFFGLPIYWVLEEKPLHFLTDYDEGGDDAINQYLLSIGGGSGEHPALIINNDAVVLDLASKFIDVDEVDPNSYDHALISFGDKLWDECIKGDSYLYFHLHQWGVNQNQWPLETFIRVHKEFNDDSNVSLIDKICHAIALFIVYEMPIEVCLKDQRIIELAKMIRSNRWEKALPASIVKYMSAVSGLLECEKYGKVIRDGQAVWGYSLNDWRREFLNSKK